MGPLIRIRIDMLSAREELQASLLSGEAMDIDIAMDELKELADGSIHVVYNVLEWSLPTSSEEWYAQLRNQSFLSLHLLMLMHEYKVEWVRELTVLDLRNLGLEYLPDTFHQLSQLTYIRLEGNPLHYVPHGLSCISLDDTQVDLLKEWEHEGYSGTEVHLTYIDSCTEAPSVCRQITKLDLSHNGLREVPDWVKHMTALRELDLSYNRLSVLPWELASLKCLQRLSITHNQVTGFPENVGRLLSLQHFDCVGNGILESEQSRIQGLLPNCNIRF